MAETRYLNAQGLVEDIVELTGIEDRKEWIDSVVETLMTGDADELLSLTKTETDETMDKILWLCVVLRINECAIPLLKERKWGTEGIDECIEAAVVNTNKELLELLLDRGSDYNHETGDKIEPPSLCQNNLALALFASVKHEYREMTKLLLERGADVNAKCAMYDEGYVLYYAVRKGKDVSWLQFLLDAGANPNIDRSAIWNIFVPIFAPQNFVQDPIPEYSVFPAIIMRLLIQFDAVYDINYENDPVLFLNFRSPLEISCLEIYRLIPGLGKLLIRILMTAGCDTNHVLYHNYRRILLDESILPLISNPLSLRCLCRKEIRRHIPDKIRENISHLPLPKQLQQYLRFSDLDEFELKEGDIARNDADY